MTTSAPETKQRCLGLVGGVSWQSTVLYYQLLNEAVSSTRGLAVRHAPAGKSFQSANLLLRNLDFSVIVRLQQRRQMHDLDRVLSGACRQLQEAGCEAVAICSNTLHQHLPAIRKELQIPVLSIIDAVKQAVVARGGIRKLLLLGTAATMHSDMYHHAFQDIGITVQTPSPADATQVNTIIFKELVHGLFTPASQSIYLNVIDRAAHEGCDAVLAGCTEIPLLLQGSQPALPEIDSLRAHVDQLTGWLLNEVK